MRVAREWLGTPFHWEASVKGVGCDCRGLLAGVARELGRPEAAAIEANLVGYSRRIDEVALLAGLDRLFDPRSAAPELGDVLAFRIPVLRSRKVQHLGLYAGNDRVIHAYSRDPAQVIESPIAGMAAQAIELAGVWRWKPLHHPSDRPPPRASSGRIA
jgi:NlpC/P60 family putative phage cell wall peptidase